MKLGVVGHPIAHSLSPVMHGAALAALGCADATYEAIDVTPDALAGFVASGALDGFNVTLPHKQTIVPYLAAVDETARAIGAVNTVARDGERLVGTNTDAAGFVQSLADAGFDVHGARVLVLGAGGAARAVAYGLAVARAESIAIAARRESAARALVDALARPAVSAHALGALDRLAPHVDLLVQATSATLTADAETFADGLPFHRLPRTVAVVDLVYRPRVTSVLRRAEREGLRTIDGTGMLVHQGALALERWLGVRPPIEVMRRALADALDRSTAELSE